ncbi:MAG: queuosine precursor transporter, partial [Acidobacteriaceae bacterium]|nr:queuosine precursor transporter [Acidobacteriaceae bacterium]
DTFLVMFISFAGTVSRPTLIRLILSSYLIKVAYETLATPLTYAGVAWLKRREGVDAFDTRTDFNPFRLRSLSPANKLETP